jgi:cytochrome c oxidase subunit 2
MVLGTIVVLSAIGIAIGLFIDWFPTPASTQADKIDTLYDVLIIASVPVFVLVTSMIGFSVLFFRMRPGQENEDGPPIHGNTRLEVIWTLIPSLLIAGLCTYAYIVLVDIEKKPAQAATQEMRLQVTGEQFTWMFTYPKNVTGGKDLTTTEMYLPVGRSVDFRIHAKDVLHDFWVPAFRQKMDAVPGITTHYRVTPNREGVYPIVCAELCGIGHATMRSTVRVVSQAAFKKWLAGQLKPAAPGAGGSPAAVAAAGKKLFAGQGCAGCHTLSDAGATGQVGPNLDKTLKGKDENFIRTSIVKPNAQIAPGFQPNIMPGNFGQALQKDELDALVAYLKEVTS